MCGCAWLMCKHDTIQCPWGPMYPGGLEPIPRGSMSYRKPNAWGKKINPTLTKKTNSSQISMVTRFAKFKSISRVGSTVCTELICEVLAVGDSLSWGFIFPIYFFDLTGKKMSWLPHYASSPLELILIVFLLPLVFCPSWDPVVPNVRAMQPERNSDGGHPPRFLLQVPQQASYSAVHVHQKASHRGTAG